MKITHLALLLALSLSTTVFSQPNEIERLKQVNQRLKDSKQEFNHGLLKELKAETKKFENHIEAYKKFKSRVDSGRNKTAKKIKRLDKKFSKRNKKSLSRFQQELSALSNSSLMAKKELTAEIKNIKWEKIQISQQAQLLNKQKEQLNHLVNTAKKVKADGEAKLAKEKKIVEGYISKAKSYKRRAKNKAEEAKDELLPSKRRKLKKKAKKYAKKAKGFAEKANSFKFSDKKIKAEIEKIISKINSEKAILESKSKTLQNRANVLNEKVQNLESLKTAYMQRTQKLNDFIGSNKSLISKVENYQARRNSLMNTLEKEMKVYTDVIKNEQARLVREYGSHFLKLYSELNYYVNSSIAGSDDSLLNYFEAKVSGSKKAEDIMNNLLEITNTAKERNFELFNLKGGNS